MRLAGRRIAFHSAPTSSQLMREVPLINTPKTVADAVLLSIARCTQFSLPLPTERSLAAVLGVQSHLQPSARQVPEPWRGSHTAPLLLLGSNPSIDPQDNSPRARETDCEIVDYYTFGGLSHFPRIPRAASREAAPKPVRYWAAVRALSASLWGAGSPDEIRPGVDFVLAEVVPYKSTGEIGVRQALPWCLRHLWAPRIQVLQAPVVVVLGAVAREALNLPAGACTTCVMGGRDRIVLTLDHPAAFGGRKRPETVASDLQLAEIRALLQAHRAP